MCISGPLRNVHRMQAPRELAVTNSHPVRAAAMALDGKENADGPPPRAELDTGIDLSGLAGLARRSVLPKPRHSDAPSAELEDTAVEQELHTDDDDDEDVCLQTGSVGAMDDVPPSVEWMTRARTDSGFPATATQHEPTADDAITSLVAAQGSPDVALQHEEGRSSGQPDLPPGHATSASLTISSGATASSYDGDRSPNPLEGDLFAVAEQDGQHLDFGRTSQTHPVNGLSNASATPDLPNEALLNLTLNEEESQTASLERQDGPQSNTGSVPSKPEPSRDAHFGSATSAFHAFHQPPQPSSTESATLSDSSTDRFAQ